MAISLPALDDLLEINKLKADLAKQEEELRQSVVEMDNDLEQMRLDNLKKPQLTHVQKVSKQILDHVIREQVHRKVSMLPGVFNASVTIKGQGEIFVRARFSNELSPQDKRATEDRIDAIVEEAGKPYGALYQ